MMNSANERDLSKEQDYSAKFDVSLTEDGEGNFLLLSLGNDCQVKLTADEARYLVNRVIENINRVECREKHKRDAMKSVIGNSSAPMPATGKLKWTK